MGPGYEATYTTLHHAREARAPYVAAELRNPIVYAYMVNGPEAAPSTMAAPNTHSLLSTTMQSGRSLESSQIQDCSSGKLAFHTSTATVTVVRRELCFRKAKNHNNIMNVNKPGSDGRPRSSLLRAPGWLRGFLRGVLRWFGLPTASFRPSFKWGGSSGRAGVTGHGLPQGKISPGDNILGHFLPQREYPRKYSPGGEYFLGQTLPPQGKISPM